MGNKTNAGNIANPQGLMVAIMSGKSERKIWVFNRQNLRAAKQALVVDHLQMQNLSVFRDEHGGRYGEPPAHEVTRPNQLSVTLVDLTNSRADATLHGEAENSDPFTVIA